MRCDTDEGESMKEKNSRDSLENPESDKEEEKLRAKSSNQNPPRTTSLGWLTTPKFGSSTSGGGEIEPGPERD
jgi:hypothetical protein